MSKTEKNEKIRNEKAEELNQEEKQTDSKKRLSWILGGGLFVLVLAVGMIVGIQKQHAGRTQEKYENQISKAEKCMEEMDYEKAKKAYEEAIRLEPKKSEPYLGMANLYVAQDQPDKAEAVLKKAVKQVEKKEQEEVKVRYQFYTYPKKALKKENGSCDAGEYECSYAGGFNEGDGGIWVESVHELQGILNWYMADYDEDGSQSEAAQPNASGQVNQSSGSEYQNLYGPLLDQVDATYGEYNDYYLYDIDGDGVKELLLPEGTCEADYMYQVYTIANGSAVYLGELSGGHTVFFEDTEGGNGSSILLMQAHMGYERISRLTLSNGSLSEEEISERELGEEEEYFDNGAPLPEAAVTDRSLLN